MTTQNNAVRAAALTLAPFTATALVLAPSPALAHDVLTGSSPEDGESLDTAPEEVVLTFNNAPLETGDGNAIAVTGPDEETTYETGDLAFDGNDVTTELEPLDQAGDYTIGYRVVSSDGHPIQDTLTFTVPEEAVADAEPEEDSAADETADEGADEAQEEQAADPAEETTAQEAADEGGISGMTVGVIIAVAVVALAAVVLVAMRVRKSTQ